jgi:chitin synthase
LPPQLNHKNSFERGNDVETCGYPQTDVPQDPAKILTQKNLRFQRTIFLTSIIVLNVVMAMLAVFGKMTKLTVTLIFFIKSKDFLSALAAPICILLQAFRSEFYPPRTIPPQWILSLIPAYSESEEQIVKTIYSLRDNGVEPNQQMMVVILDGKPRDIASQLAASMEILAITEH